MMNYFPSRLPILPIEQFNVQRYDIDERFNDYTRPTNTGRAPFAVGREGYIKNYLHSDSDSIATGALFIGVAAMSIVSPVINLINSESDILS